ncbi:PIN domain-containing protein [Leptospira bandrabouensis]|uniref:PIN domain-containing protein n=3 Tax=Leptospira bandrabouensis TaxID=2484903 RepID=A0A6H3NIK2_9LEPT|nr:PIN domain-containing protein [Leptospira bandrabouensis]MCG6154163.1 PIN domain-containing protein [Leptospira bandrabouensis]MCW7460384.1 PIN domain-containing protein [Leptospira bandrabouensis]TGN10317.1 PIN domain-containing protein [Leptospira bandrabouensis]
MALYIDTSFLLNIVYSEQGFEKNLEILNKSNNLFSSILIEIESYRSLNFTFNQNKKYLDNNWYQNTHNFIEKLISNINLKNLDSEIKNEFKKHKNISELKSLDAIHLSTALYVKKLISEDLIFCSLDEKLIEVALKNNFKVN